MFNPNEEFVIVSIHRKTIAEMFNEIIEERGLGNELFSGNDARLTSEVCREVASAFSEAYDEGGSEEERGAAERDGVSQVFMKYFS